MKEKIPEGKTTCGLGSRLRRGTLYAFAEEIGATKTALGHHKDDIVETMFLNMFYGSRLSSMLPKLCSDDGRNMVSPSGLLPRKGTLFVLPRDWNFQSFPATCVDHKRICSART